MFLKQSTASQSRILGPFLDDTDFKTAETALSIANTDVKLMKNGGASANKNSGGGTHRVNGHYVFTFDATDTNTVGELQVSIVKSGALPVFKTFFVVEESVYDAYYASGAAGYNSSQVVASVTGSVTANVTQVGGYAPYVDATITDSTYTPTSTQFELTTDPFGSDGNPRGLMVIFPDSGDTAYGVNTFCTDYDASEKLVTVRTMWLAPSSGDTVRFMLI